MKVNIVSGSTLGAAAVTLVLSGLAVRSKALRHREMRCTPPAKR